MKLKRCCICKKFFLGYGNNPWPVVKKNNVVCCNYCNDTKVIPERIKNMEGK